MFIPEKELRKIITEEVHAVLNEIPIPALVNPMGAAMITTKTMAQLAAETGFRVPPYTKQNIAKQAIKNIALSQGPKINQQAEEAQEKGDVSWFKKVIRRPELIIPSEYLKLGKLKLQSGEILIKDKVSLKNLRFVSDSGALRGMVLQFDIGDPKTGGGQTSNYFLQTKPIKLLDDFDIEATATISTEELGKMMNKKNPQGKYGVVFDIGNLSVGGQISWNKGLQSASGRLAMTLPFGSTSIGVSQKFDPKTRKPRQIIKNM